jgi:hypothetical protein
MKPCGVTYWLITVAQIPIAVAFTACIVSQKRKLQTRNSQVAELVKSSTLFFRQIILVQLYLFARIVQLT